MNKNIRKNNKGITLIALVITIIVLLILAGVSIAMLTGQNGILTKAGDAKTITEQAKIDEQRKLTQAEATMNFEETNHTETIDVNEITVKIPAYCAVSQVEGENTLDKGLVIIDKNGNEWVWIEVPKTVFTKAAGDNPNVDDIKADLISYAIDYREGKTGQGCNWSDEWYDVNGGTDEAKVGGMGLTKTEYNNLRNKMLTSVYNNGGFYIGKYEAGDETTTSAGLTGRLEESSTQTPVIQKNKYPYNYVTCSQAQGLATNLATEGKTSSLMFGIQWDLVMKYLEVKGTSLGETADARKAKLKTDSTSWGNYNDGRFNLITGSYSENYGASWTVQPKEKTSNGNILLTTGSIQKNSCMNVYDIAGNVWEWTLEKTSYFGSPCANRGGSFSSSGYSYPASNRNNIYATKSYNNVGFRTTLY